jgi:hypothetical protein
MVPVDFDEIVVGESLGEYQYRLSPGRILKYLEGVESHHPWFEGPSPYGGPIAPPMVCDSDVIRLPGVQERIIAGGTEGPVANRKGFLHAAQSYELLDPAFPGKRIVVTGRVVDKYEKSGRVWVVAEALSADEDGRPILRSRATFCWLR